MSKIISGPQQIVTDGLVLHLDAANTKSYQSGSTTWNDLSGNRNNGTLVNGPTFSSGNGGSIVFDGVNDYIDLGTTSTFSFIQNTGVFTICAWVRLTDFSTARFMLGNNDGTGGRKGFNLGYRGTSGRLWLAMSDGGGAILDLTRNNFFINSDWVFVTVVGNGTTCQFYRNGLIFGAPSNTFTRLSTGDSFRVLGLGRLNNYTLSNSYWQGNITQTQIYNKTLTAEEILQNYNATKSRFNLT